MLASTSWGGLLAQLGRLNHRRKLLLPKLLELASRKALVSSILRPHYIELAEMGAVD